MFRDSTLAKRSFEISLTCSALNQLQTAVRQKLLYIKLIIPVDSLLAEDTRTHG